MKNEILRVPYIVYSLNKSSTVEDTITTLNTLYDVIMNNNEEINLFFNIGGSNLIMNCLRSDDRLQNICLKILANAAKKDEKIRKTLQTIDMFYLLAEQLQREKDFTANTIILYATLIVILVQGDEEAQNQMRKSGCFDHIIQILICIMNEVDIQTIPTRNIEIVIYSLAASIKDPQNSENQTQIGWILPKILDFLSKQIVFVDVDQIHLLKCFWSFVRSILDQNEINQNIFTKCMGAIVTFRSLQDILEDEKFEKLEDLATKITGVLVKLKSQKEFLCQSSNYCSVTILCSLLKTKNSLIILNVLTFLNSLTQETPQILNLITNKEILRRIKKPQKMLRNVETQAESCSKVDFKPSSQDIQNRVFEDIIHYPGFPSNSQNFFCTLHDTDLDNIHESVVTEKRQEKLLDHLNFHRNQTKTKEKNLQAIVKRNPNHVGLRRKTGIIKYLSIGVISVIKRFWSFLFKRKSRKNSHRENHCPWDGNCRILNDQLIEYYNILRSEKHKHDILFT